MTATDSEIEHRRELEVHESEVASLAAAHGELEARVSPAHDELEALLAECNARAEQIAAYEYACEQASGEQASAASLSTLPVALRATVGTELVSARAEMASNTAQLRTTQRLLDERRAAVAVVLEGRLAQLQEEHSSEQAAHNEALARRLSEAAGVHGRSADLVESKSADIEQHGVQIDTLESERQELKDQAQRLADDLVALENELSISAAAEAELDEEARRATQECSQIDTTLRSDLAGVHAALERREMSLARESEAASHEERTANDTLESVTSKLRAASFEAQTSEDSAEREIEELNAMISATRQGTTALGEECQTRECELKRLSLEDATAQSEQERYESKAEYLQEQLATARARFQAAIEETERRRADIKDQLLRMRESADEDLKTSEGGTDNGPKDLELLLNGVSDRLAEALEAARRNRGTERELSTEVDRVKQLLQSNQDRMAHQVEHDNLQFETIHKLEEQKRRFEGEVEVLTLGLHDAEQRNVFLQKENYLMQQQVEGLYQGSLKDWAAEVQRVQVAAEVAKYREEIDIWKQKAESARRDKQQELSRVQGQHEEAMKGLRDRITTMQKERDQRASLIRTREKTLSGNRAVGSRQGPAAPSSTEVPPAVLGLQVPQRPLPLGHHRRKALLVGSNYSDSHAPLKGCVNDIWAVQCLLRHTLQYQERQVRMLLDINTSRAEAVATKENIIAGLKWLVEGAQPGDTLFFYFSGYGAQHPQSPKGSADQCEAYLVPTDFGADVPRDFFQADGTTRGASTAGSGGLQKSTSWLGSLTNRVFRSSSTGQPSSAGGTGGYVVGGYRLIPLTELNVLACQLPPGCRLTVVIDACYPIIPNISQVSNQSASFKKVERGRVDYTKLRDFISRPRFLELPVLPVQHSPDYGSSALRHPQCVMHCFTACRLQEWCAEFPIEGTVQGAFTWAFIRALAQGHYNCGVYQLMRAQATILADLKIHFKGVEQTPAMQLSPTAGLHDVVLWT